MSGYAIVRYGSKADLIATNANVRFVPHLLRDLRYALRTNYPAIFVL